MDEKSPIELMLEALYSKERFFLDQAALFKAQAELCAHLRGQAINWVREEKERA